MENDKRCPCNICAVQTICTEYCNEFHYYRKLILSEVDAYITQIIGGYKVNKTTGRFISEIRHDLKTANKKYIEHKIKPIFEYTYVVEKLKFLEIRFSIIIENSHRAKRGSAMKGFLWEN